MAPASRSWRWRTVPEAARTEVRDPRFLAVVGACALATASCTGPAQQPQAQPQAALSGPVVQSSLLELTRAPQRTSLWCWAASSQMVLRYLLGAESPAFCGADGILSSGWLPELGGMPPECEAVCNSCGDPEDPELVSTCVTTSWPRLERFGLSYERTPNELQKSPQAALSWPLLKEQLQPGSDGRAAPFLFSWHWEGGGGHIMVANGFVEDEALDEKGRFVLVEDPWPPCIGDTYFLTYEAWVGSNDNGRQHWRDYWNLRVEGSDGAPASETPAERLAAAAARARVVETAAAAKRASADDSFTMPAMIPILPVASPLDVDGEGPPGVEPEALARAREGLLILQGLVDEKRTRRQLGFWSKADLVGAVLSDRPIWEVVVPLDQLADFALGESADDLLRADGWIFPVTSKEGGAVLTAIHVDRGRSGWFLTEMGGKGWIGKLAAAYRSCAYQDPPWPIQETVLVSVPGLRRYYLGRHFAAGDPRRISIANSPGPAETSSRPASEVFAELAAKAADHDGEPG